MNWFQKIMSNCFFRVIAGLLMIMVFGPLSAVVFPPLMIFMFLGVFLFLFSFDTTKEEWKDARRTQHCPHCKAECPVKVVKVRHYMMMPPVFILLLFAWLKIPYRSSYYLVCAECLEKHTDKQNLAAISTIAQADMATVKEITK